jgi:hypothetical protein
LTVLGGSEDRDPVVGHLEERLFDRIVDAQTPEGDAQSVAA